MRCLFVVMLLLMPYNAALSQSINSIVHPEGELPSQDVVNVVDTVLKCAEKSKLTHNNILTVIDYSLPSTEKRLWVYNLNEDKLLYHTYVSHGIKSGLLESEFFSNKKNSKTTSLGVFKTENSYDGRYGLALKLQGFENGFNNNAYERFLVMHPAWYVTEEFIKKYGRLGRSWGCPAISYDSVDAIINTIKEDSLLIVYYPSDKWLSESKYLTCDKLNLTKNLENVKKMPEAARKEKRSSVMFADKNKNNKFDESDPIIVISADNYQAVFKKPAPLSRMLRRQFKNKEYISLNNAEMQQLDVNDDNVINMNDETIFDHIDFFVAEVHKIDGYWATEFKSVKEKNEIKSVKSNPTLSTPKGNIILKSTDKFIRWLGL